MHKRAALRLKTKRQIGEELQLIVRERISVLAGCLLSD
jgi:hypothetical protein